MFFEKSMEYCPKFMKTCPFQKVINKKMQFVIGNNFFFCFFRVIMNVIIGQWNFLSYPLNHGVKNGCLEVFYKIRVRNCLKLNGMSESPEIADFIINNVNEFVSINNKFTSSLYFWLNKNILLRAFFENMLHFPLPGCFAILWDIKNRQSSKKFLNVSWKTQKLGNACFQFSSLFA